MTVLRRRGDDEAILLAGAIESGSSHPVARALTDYAASHGRLPDLGTHEAARGSGVSGRVGEPGRARRADPSGSVSARAITGAPTSRSGGTTA